MEHCCLGIVYQTKVRPDLRDTPFLEEFQLFVDDSSKMIQGEKTQCIFSGGWEK
jgi:hypothetical protein